MDGAARGRPSQCPFEGRRRILQVLEHCGEAHEVKGIGIELGCLYGRELQPRTVDPQLDRSAAERGGRLNAVYVESLARQRSHDPTETRADVEGSPSVRLGDQSREGLDLVVEEMRWWIDIARIVP